MTTISKVSAHKTAGGRRPRQTMTPRELEAYLVSRDEIRRIQRTSGLVTEASLRGAARHSSH